MVAGVGFLHCSLGINFFGRLSHDIMFRAPIWPIAQGNEEENPDKDKYGLFMVLVIGMLTAVYHLAILRV